MLVELYFWLQMQGLSDATLIKVIFDGFVTFFVFSGFVVVKSHNKYKIVKE